MQAETRRREPSTDGSKRGPRLLWKRMLLLSLLLRLAVIAFTWSYASPRWFFAQASELAVLAESLRSGHGFSHPFGPLTGPSAFLAPGYPAVIAAVFALFHPFSLASAVAITLLQALFAGATTVLLMHVAQRLFNVKTANLAGAFWAASPALLWVPTIFWETSLSILLLTALLALALRCIDSPGRTSWLLLGSLGAAVPLINSSLLTVVLSCFGWALWQGRRRGISAPMLGMALFLLLSSLWPARNLHVMHAWIPLRSNMGYELWQGNRPGTDGFFLVDLHPNTSVVERHRWEELGEIGYMQEKTALAKAAIRADPARFAALTAKRILCFWIVVPHIVMTTLFGLWGAALAIHRRRWGAALLLLPLLLFPLPYYITHPDFRFRLVLDPILILLGAYAVMDLATQRSWGNGQPPQRSASHAPRRHPAQSYPAAPGPAPNPPTTG
jgi:hypothetical protein